MYYTFRYLTLNTFAILVIINHEKLHNSLKMTNFGNKHD